MSGTPMIYPASNLVTGADFFGIGVTCNDPIIALIVVFKWLSFSWVRFFSMILGV